MNPNRDPRIDAYLSKSAAFAQPILRHLRELVHQGCPAATETIKWGFPHFEHAGGILCSMAAFKAHCAFGFWHRGMKKILGAHGAESATAMGSLGRIASLADLPDAKVMLRFIREAVRLNEAGVPARPRPAAGPRRKELPVPADLAVAFRKDRKAATAFEHLSPSHRREYVEWITEAKREETRATRLATTLQWLAEGKSRNWKYEKC